MRHINLRIFSISALLIAILSLAGCVPPQSNSNGNTANLNTANNNTANANTVVSNDAGIDAREPAVYRAKITFKAETIGDKEGALPAFSVDYVRNQADRRIAFNVPGAGPVVYLDVKDKRYVIMPDRKQYADLSADSTGGVQIPSSLTPGEIVNRLKTTKGYELVGDDTFNGRPVIKYRFAGSKPTNTAVGTVSAEAYVLVDKETGLPLRSETVTEGSNDVKGVKGIKLITEMSEIQTSVDPATFDLPTGLTKVSTQEIKEKVEGTVRIALALLAQLRQNQGGAPATGPSAATATSPVK